MADRQSEFSEKIRLGDQAGAIAILKTHRRLANAVVPSFTWNVQAIIAATWCDCPELVQSLLDHGAPIETAWEDEKWRPLHFAAKDGLLAVGQILLDHGACVEARDARDKTPLFWSIIERHFEFAELLLKRGAAIDQRWKGYALLHHEAKDGKTPTVEFMLKHGADPNIRDDRVQPGSTPLHGAARQDRLNAAKVLLAYGAEVNAKTALGQTPLDAAYASKGQMLVTLLEEHGARRGEKVTSRKKASE